MEVAEGVSLCRRCLHPADHSTFFASKRVGRLSARVPPWRDGNSFFSGVLNIEWHPGPGTSPWRVRLMPAETPLPVSPLLGSPNRENGANLPRNISTRMGVCRVEAVGLTSVSPRD